MLKSEKRNTKDENKLREKLSKLFREQGGAKQYTSKGPGKMSLNTAGFRSGPTTNNTKNAKVNHKQSKVENNLRQNGSGRLKSPQRKPPQAHLIDKSKKTVNKAASEICNGLNSKTTRPSSPKPKSQRNTKHKPTNAGGKPKNITPHVIELKFNNGQAADSVSMGNTKSQTEINVDATQKSQPIKNRQQDNDNPSKSQQTKNALSGKKKKSSDKKEENAKPKKQNVKSLLRNTNDLLKSDKMLKESNKLQQQSGRNVETKHPTKRVAPTQQLNQYQKQGKKANQQHVNSLKEYSNTELTDSESDMDSINDLIDNHSFDEDNDDYDCSSISSSFYDEDDDDSCDYIDSENDQLSYSDDDEDDYDSDEETGSSDFFDVREDHDETDEDYKLPKHVPEDLIIHQGTATKYPIPKAEPVLLDSENDEPHMVEVMQSKIACVKQPQEYSIDALNKLNDSFAKIEINFQKVIVKKKAVLRTEDSDSSICPDLVSIADEDVLSDDSFDERYEKISDIDSIISDINEKYTAVDSSDSDMSEDTGDELYCKDDIKVTTTHATAIPIAPPPCFSDTTNNLLEESIEDDCRTYDTQCTKSGEVFTIPFIEIEQSAQETTISRSSQDSFKSITNSSSQLLNSPDELNDSIDVEPEIDNFCTPANEKSINRNLFFNAINSNDVLVLLKDPFYIYGTLRITLLSGNVDIFGHAPTVNKRYEIYSPRGCSMIQVMPQKSVQDDKQGVAQALAESYRTFLKSNLETILEKYVPGQDAVLLLQRNFGASKIIGNFRKFMSENVFPNLRSVPTDRPYYNSEYLLQCIINDDCDKTIKVSPDWQSLKINSQTKMMITGGKSVGKSTLLRYLINSHLNKYPNILLIDLDIGQPELFVPQTVSCTSITEPLLGPGFFLLRQPDKAFMVGHVNVAYCAEIYMRAVKQLLEYCYSQPEYSNIPWVINTMGYNKGFGLELIACVVNYLQPTDVVQLQSNKPINNFDVPLESSSLSATPRIIYGADEFKPAETRAKSSHHLHLLNSAVLQESRHQKDWNMSASDIRYAMILARLSGALQESDQWLTDCTPLCASFDDLHFVNMQNKEDSREALIGAVEANLVYLCHLDKSSPSLECFGIGVVRAIDYNMNQLYLLPATLMNRLMQVNCLALGEIPLPNSLFLNQGPKIRGVVPFVSSTVDANASKAIKQIYHRPPEFLTGVHRAL